MKVVTLTPEDAMFAHFNTKFIVTYADGTGAATTNLTLLPASGTLGNRQAVLRTGYDLITPFTGGSISAMTLDLGDVGSASRFIAAASTDLFTAIATSAKNCLISTTAFAYPGSYIAANGILKGLLTATGDNVNAATAGEIHIYAQIVDLSKGQYQK